MVSRPGVDHPEEQSEVHVTLTGHGISVSTRVELAGDGVLTVRPSVGKHVEQVVAAVGDRAEVSWAAGDEILTLPAEVVSVEQGAAPRWRLRISGPPRPNQRREAVRARVALPIAIRDGDSESSGETIDLSESGVRAVCPGPGDPPEPGATVDLILQLEDDAVPAKGELVRIQPARGGRWMLSIRFVDLPEKDGDRLRRRVFQALREERARLAP